MGFEERTAVINKERRGGRGEKYAAAEPQNCALLESREVSHHLHIFEDDEIGRGERRKTKDERDELVVFYSAAPFSLSDFENTRPRLWISRDRKSVFVFFIVAFVWETKLQATAQYVPGDVQISRTTVTTTCLYRTCVTTSFKLLLIGTGCAISFYQKNVRRCFYFSSTYLRDTRLLSPRVPFFVANGTVTPNKRNILNMQRTRDSIFVPPLQPNELLCGLLWDPRQVWWIDCYGPSRCRRTAVV